MKNKEVWFWHTIISPHMIALAEQMAVIGWDVYYVAFEQMSLDRIQQGWIIPDQNRVKVITLDEANTLEKTFSLADADAVHICEGLRRPEISQVQALCRLRMRKYWVIMETVDDAGWRGILRRLVYRFEFHNKRKSLAGVLAIGHRTPNWVRKRGGENIHAFAYYLPTPLNLQTVDLYPSGRVIFMFAGQLIRRKRVDLLLTSFASLPRGSCELWIVGSGKAESELRELAKRLEIEEQVVWFGQVAMDAVPSLLVGADCLVLPSAHDGWGAIASEALLAGTPVICSDTSGVAGVVRASLVGGVFAYPHISELVALMSSQIHSGRITSIQRQEIGQWASCIEAAAGAAYLDEILRWDGSGALVRPRPGWAV